MRDERPDPPARGPSLTFADFLSGGEFDRHLRRMRPVYRRRRDALIAALRKRLPDFEPAGVAAGIHLVAWLPPDLGERAVIEASAQRGLRVNGLARYRIEASDRGGSIFGHSSLDERSIERAVALLAAVVSELRG